MLVRGLSCKLYVRIEGIKVGKELLGVFCLINNKGVIHAPKQDPWGFGEVLSSLASKSSIKRLATKGLMGDPIAALCTCS